jgi:hypothetical protein
MTRAAQAGKVIRTYEVRGSRAVTAQNHCCRYIVEYEPGMWVGFRMNAGSDYMVRIDSSVCTLALDEERWLPSIRGADSSRTMHSYVLEPARRRLPQHISYISSLSLQRQR